MQLLLAADRQSLLGEVAELRRQQAALADAASPAGGATEQEVQHMVSQMEMLEEECGKRERQMRRQCTHASDICGVSYVQLG